MNDKYYGLRTFLVVVIITTIEFFLFDVGEKDDVAYRVIGAIITNSFLVYPVSEFISEKYEGKDSWFLVFLKKLFASAIVVALFMGFVYGCCNSETSNSSDDYYDPYYDEPYMPPFVR